MESLFAIRLLTNTGTDPPSEAVYPKGSNRFRASFIQPSMKYVTD